LSSFQCLDTVPRSFFLPFIQERRSSSFLLSSGTFTPRTQTLTVPLDTLNCWAISFSDKPSFRSSSASRFLPGKANIRTSYTYYSIRTLSFESHGCVLPLHYEPTNLLKIDTTKLYCV